MFYEISERANMILSYGQLPIGFYMQIRFAKFKTNP